MKLNKRFFLCICLLLAALLLTACQKSAEPVPTGYPAGQIDQPQIMYDGRIYYYWATGFDGAMPEDYSFAGEVERADNENLPAENFAGCRVEEGQKIYAKPESSCIYLEYEAGYAEFSLSNTEAPTVQVEITMDNWQEYFELKTIDRWADDGSGASTALTQLAGLWVKPEYRDRILNEGDADLMCELTFDRVERKIDVDYANRIYTWGEAVSTEAGCSASEQINYFAGYPDGTLMVFGTGNTLEKGNDMCLRDENMELSHIAGTIRLAME